MRTMRGKTWAELLPMWAKFKRGGRRCDYVRLEMGPSPASFLLHKPAIDGDETWQPLEASEEVVPFDSVTIDGIVSCAEDEVMRLRRMRRQKRPEVLERELEERREADAAARAERERLWKQQQEQSGDSLTYQEDDIPF